MAKGSKSGKGKNKTTRKFHNPSNTGAQPTTVKINMAYKNCVKKTPFISGKKLIR